MSLIEIRVRAALEDRLWNHLTAVDENDYCEKKLVGRIEGFLKVVIYANEHPPPHFHVTFGNEDASFTIDECRLVRGDPGLKKKQKLIREWWKNNRKELARTWNEFRPSDCTVGPVKVPA